MTGRVYLERGQPVTVLIAYCARRVPDVTADWLHFQWPGRRPAAGPHNVAIRRTDGSIAVRPFRGLTRSTPADGAATPRVRCPGGDHKHPDHPCGCEREGAWRMVWAPPTEAGAVPVTVMRHPAAPPSAVILTPDHGAVPATRAP